ncbi:MAG: carboxypeptidase-like regulatory domain-containing protein [Chryseolinea sp.]
MRSFSLKNFALTDTLYFALFFTLALTLTLPFTAFAQKDFYTKTWSEVYKYEVKDLPASALKVVDTIYYKARKDKNITEITKSLLYQSKFALTLQEDAELIIVQKFKKQIAESDAPLKNLLESMLAQIYWQYFQAHRWEFYRRSTVTVTVTPTDFRTWDAPAMLTEIDRHFQGSMFNSTVLKNTKLDSFDDILALAEQSKRYRPTLYDFLLNFALDFYAADEEGIRTPSSYKVFMEKELFSPIDNVPFADTISTGKYEALKLFRHLLIFHRQNRDTNAYVNLEIERLKFVQQHSVLSNTNELFTTALRNIKAINQHHPASTLIDFELASDLLSTTSNNKQDTTHRLDKGRALAICNAAMSKFPDSDGAARCKAVKEFILTKRLSIETETFLPVSKPSRLLVDYANLATLHFRVYKVPVSVVSDFRRMSDSIKTEFLSRNRMQTSWESALPQTGDYENHTTEVIMPALPSGNYLIVASERDPLSASDEVFAYTTVKITDLVLLKVDCNNFDQFQVVDRNNGKPISGADIHLKSNNSEPGFVPIDRHYETDKQGFANQQTRDNVRIDVTVSSAGDTLFVPDYYYYSYRENRRSDVYVTAQSFLFTDRSIYRPGQTVFFKGILIQKKDRKSSIVKNEFVEVFLESSNGDDVASLRVKTNAYGSFSGEFKLPASGLTGDYTIYADEDSEDDSRFYDNIDDFEYSETTISVEEYKRPTFEVTIKPLTGTLKLNDTIKVVGNAIAYSGSKISKAKVAYTVKRNVRYPHWYWEFENHDSGDNEIIDGEVETNEKGEFVVPFKATPDDNVKPETKPVYTFTISVDVTDINGETRSSESTVRVGYHSMQATVSAPMQIDMQQPMATLSVTTENLNGQFLPAKGTLKVYKLKGPDKPVRKRPWDAPDVPSISRAEFERLFPNDPYGDDAGKPTSWPKGRLASELSFNTKLAKELKLTIDKTWALGSYLIELNTTDSLGRAVEDRTTFEITDANGKSVPDNAAFIFQTDKTSYKSGDVARIKVGSALKDVFFTIAIEKDHKIVKTMVEQISNGTHEITVPVSDEYENGISIHCSAPMLNTFIQYHKTLVIESHKQELFIETETFKDKLQPGSKQTWSFTINGEGGPMREAEVVASMYDASLDAFKPHEWSFNPIERQFHYSQYRINPVSSFGAFNFTVNNLRPYRLNAPQQNYDNLDWFGFNLANTEYAKRKYQKRLHYSAVSIGKPSKVTQTFNKSGRTGFIYGRITDTQSDPIPGVNVLVKGTTRGTMTDAEGYYSIEAVKDEVLVYSFIGFVTAEVKVARKNMIDVRMEEDVTELSEVVVVGYGVQTKKELAGSVAAVAVSASETISGDIDFTQALQGRVPGVQIRASNQTYSVVIRGSTSLSADSRPLYVVDGVVVESSTIDQADLASAQVLKGDAAVALYGSRAANGVIIITTKSGQQKLDNALAKVNARKNFNETAFFYPHLSTDDNGRIKFSFTTPESLTRWKVQLLAHTKELITSAKTLQAITQKELMITPNVPRFVRVGDELIISAKIANLSNRKLDGKIALQLTNPITGASADQLLSNIVRNQTFKTAAKGNTQISWSIKVPEGIDAIQYKIVAKAGSFSDGEQNVIPVLQNHVLVTETMPLYIRSNQTKTFTLAKLQSQSSPTLQHHQLTLEITSNPAWYAIQSMPYLMEFPHECAEQLFSRFYSNSIASHVVNSNPKIKAVFDKWAATGALTSNLENNQELKSIMIEETPWLRDAEDETDSKKRIALLFDLNTMSNQLKEVAGKLKDMQFSSGGFPWFSGSQWPSRFITQHVASGYGHLRKLDIATDPGMKEMITKAVQYLDAENVIDYRALLKDAGVSASNAKGDEKQKLIERFLKDHLPSSHAVHYLYMRSFYPDVYPDASSKEAIDYFQKQTASKWLDYPLYEKGLIALIQQRSGNNTIARDIIASLKENAIVSDELGMYWKQNTGGYRWNEGTVETQALMIEAFAEITEYDSAQNGEQNQKTIDELRMWLLKNKQTNSWKTTKATTEAIYALLLRGTDWLSLENSVDVSVANVPVTIASTEPEAGTGYFKTTWKGDAVTRDMATVTLSKKDAGIAWGGLYWQYFEDLDKITPAETPLKLKKNVYKVVIEGGAEKLHPVANEILKPGDLIRIRIELTADRAMEYLHMKDMRAAGFEPVDVLSAYRWQGGLGYYQSTRDAATNFFFEHVPKGVYVFEYDLRVNVKGNFSNGITTIQSMYAPEFSSHSEGIRVKVE